MKIPRVNVAIATALAVTAFMLGLYVRTPAVTTRPTEPSKPGAGVKVETFALAGTELHDALRRGGYVVFVRHPTRVDTKTVTPFDAALLSKQPLIPSDLRTGVCLNDEGRAEAWLLGRTVAALAIPVGKVMASPTCRTRESAELAFGRVDEVTQFLAYPNMFPKGERKRAGQELLRLLATSPANGTNTFLFSHGNTLEHIGFNVKLDQADAAVFAPGDPPQLVGKASLLDLVHLQPTAIDR